jgi:hypothetical protein
MNNHLPSRTPPGQSNDGQDITVTTGETPSGRKERFHLTNIPKACDVSAKCKTPLTMTELSALLCLCRYAS